MTTAKRSAHPDSDLYPQATGPAWKIVEAHQKEEPLKLYSGWFCPFVQRVWAVLEEKGIPYQYIEVNPYNKPESLMKLNPRGLVPTLQYNDKPLFESTVVLQFLEEAYPDHKPQILPQDPYDRARSRIWADFMTSRIIPAFHRFLQFQPMANKERLQEKRKEFLATIKEFVAEMDPTGPWFLGSEPSFVDFVVAPWALRMWVFDYYKGGLGIPAEGEPGDDDIWRRWRRWVKAVEGRKSIADTMSEREHYLQIYQRYADNTAMSELAKATRKGRGVP